MTGGSRQDKDKKNQKYVKNQRSRLKTKERDRAVSPIFVSRCFFPFFFSYLTSSIVHGFMGRGSRDARFFGTFFCLLVALFPAVCLCVGEICVQSNKEGVEWGL
jgi:hypothetical protein